MKEKVEQLIAEGIEGTDIFVVKLTVSSSNEINVLLDSDSGLSLADCRTVSRAIEFNLDREEEDFGLEVTSPDISHPLSVKRQYLKNINRILKVKTAEQELEGTLISANEKEISLRWKTREPKPIGKGKVTVEKNALIAFNSIKEAKVKITF